MVGGVGRLPSVKPFSASIAAIAFLSVAACGSQPEGDISDLKGPYLGQEPPGLKAEVFAPGIVSTEHFEAFGIFAPDMEEFYFKRRGGDYERSTLLVFQYKNDLWTQRVVSSSRGEPFISPDGQRLYLGNKVMERTATGWSEAKPLGSPFDDMPIMRLTASKKGTYVFDVREEIGAIRYSRLIDGERGSAKTIWRRNQYRKVDLPSLHSAG